MHHAKAKFAGSVQTEEIKVNLSDEIEWNENVYNINSLAWQAPVTGTIYGMVFNFKDQYEAMEKHFSKKPYNKPPNHPVMYIKPRNTVNGHLRPVPVPAGIEAVEINATLGIVIGENATRISKSDAFHYIAGYTIVNDVSIPHHSFYRPDIKNKVRDGFCPIGPWIIAQESIANPDQLQIKTYRNGELVQESNTKNLIRPIGQLLCDVTEFMTLSKGDMLLVGIPNHAPLARPGDTVRIEVEQIGYLENQVIEAAQMKPGGGM